MGPEISPPLSEPTFCILAALTEPRHGYAIMQWVAEVTRDRVKLGPGTLYGALGTLQDRGLILPADEGAAGSERRKVFVLTDQGKALLAAETDRLEASTKIGRTALGH